jgi:hypothetical protein
MLGSYSASIEANMNRIARNARRLLSALGAAALVSCGGALPDINFGFDTPQDVQLDAPSSSVSAVYPFDLSSNATVQQYKAKVKALTLDTLAITVTDTTTTGTGGGTNAASSVTGTVALRPGGATTAANDVQVGALTNFAIAKNATITLNGSTALNTFVFNTLQGNGQFSVVVAGSTAGGNAHLKVHLVPHMTLTYSP